MIQRTHPDDDTRSVRCPACGWIGTIGETDDMDTQPEGWNGPTVVVCVCPSCAEKVIASTPQVPRRCDGET